MIADTHGNSPAPQSFPEVTLSGIATAAHDARQTLITLECDGDRALVGAAVALVEKIGFVADVILARHGFVQVCGGAEQWLLSDGSRREMGQAPAELQA